jgi:hypothetical protein
MNKASVSSVLWLDDEFETRYAFSLAPWQRVLDKRVRAGQMKVQLCNTLGKFRNLVEDRIQQLGTADSPFELLIIDVMLNLEETDNYSEFGFPDEDLIHLEAGAQIAGLIRGSQHEDKLRPPWLKALATTPLLLLSASPMAPNWVRRQVGHSRMKGVEVILKDLRRKPDVVEPSEDFDAAVGRLVGLG